MKKAALIIALVCTLLGCGKDTTEKETSLYNNSMKRLNQRDYEGLIYILQNKDPIELESQGLITFLIDGHLGFCQFDAEEINRKAELIKKYQDLETDDDETRIRSIFKALKMGTSRSLCRELITRSVWLIENYSLKGLSKNAGELYKGNLYLIETLYILEEVISNIPDEETDLKKGLNLLIQIDELQKARENLESISSHYKKSYKELISMIEFVDDILAFQVEEFSP